MNRIIHALKLRRETRDSENYLQTEIIKAGFGLCDIQNARKKSKSYTIITRWPRKPTPTTSHPEFVS